MTARSTFALFAAAALLAPLVAVAMPVCGPSEHCPMAAMMAGDPPCHGSSIQADDCCVSSATAEPAEMAPVTGSTHLVATEIGSAPQPESSFTRPAATSLGPPSTPLYRLFRALLI